MSDTPTLYDLAHNLFAAKRAEDAAKKLRIDAEEAIAALVETKCNGSKTVDAGDLKVVVKRGMSYTANVDAIRALNLPKDMVPLTETPPVPAGWALDEKGYEWLRENKPDLFAKVAAFVEAKPKKVSVTLKL